MPRSVLTEEVPWDLSSSKVIGITIAKHSDGYRIWVHEADKGMLVRAYRVEGLALELDEATQVDLGWTRP